MAKKKDNDSKIKFECELEPTNLNDFTALKLSLASQEDVMFWSHGEVTRAETINYRTHRSEPAGLMCEKIFGPTKSFQCYCGKYRKAKFKGIVCDKCGVEVTHKTVRRERMGHIKLASPIVHIWYVHGVPNKLSIILGIPQKKLQATVYFSRYMITEVDEKGRKPALRKVQDVFGKKKKAVKKELDSEVDKKDKEIKKEIDVLKKITDREKRDIQKEKIEHKGNQEIAKIREEYKRQDDEIEEELNNAKSLIKRVEIGEIISEEEKILLENYKVKFFKVKMGAEAIKDQLSKVDIEELSKNLHKELDTSRRQKRAKLIQRLKIIDSMIQNKIDPTWLVTDILPVLPPDLRPIVPIAGGRFASSDLNDLYRRVINRNNRLKKLIEIGAPEVILRNEKRMLQESADALFDNSHRPTRPVLNSRRLPLKSLSDSFRGKSGRFRQNLLGKRVDYSGRAVIVTAGVDLKLNQVGVPKEMALELFKPFVINKLLDQGSASNVRNVRFLVEERSQEVWDVLAEVIKDYPVLLNRAPTLHKQGIQAFYPVLVEGDALRMPPMIMAGFAGDFDGDQMAIHIPLSDQAKEECKKLMMAQSNILRSGDGSTIIRPDREIIQGAYYMTSIREDAKAVPTVFADKMDAISAYENRQIELRAPIKILMDDEVVKTSVGRILFNEILPEEYDFVNEEMNKGKLTSLTGDIFTRFGADKTIETLDRMNREGFKMATSQGFSPGISDCISPPNLDESIEKALEKTHKLVQEYEMGFISDFERAQEFRTVWTKLMDKARVDTVENMDKENPVRAAIEAKSRWDESMITQIAAFKGVIQDAMGNTIELPVTHNFVDGLTEFEYFISCRGARKGLIDTALNTAQSGYLTRRLVDVAHDAIIREKNCRSKEGFTIYKEDDKFRRDEFVIRIQGRYLAKSVKNPETGKVIAKRNTLITKSIAKKIDAAGVDQVEIRSPITCHTPYGLCQTCYGVDHGTRNLVEIGRPVGVLAAQALGEPSTQLVLRTFHKGGVIGQDITHGLPRVEELFEARVPKGAAVIAEIDGVVSIEQTKKDNVIVSITNLTPEVFHFSYHSNDTLLIGRKKNIKEGEPLFKDERGKIVKAPETGKIKVDKKKKDLVLESKQTEEVKYEISIDEELLVKEGDEVKAGQLITQGNIDPSILVKTKGMLEAQRYTINHIQKVYSEQAATVADVHVETIVSQMSRLVEIIDPGDTKQLTGEFHDKHAIIQLNKELEKLGKKPVRYRHQLLGVKAASLKKDSFLSAASFQEQVRVLSEAAITGAVDHLRGLKESVIIGRVIPVGERAKILTDLEGYCYGENITAGKKTKKKEEKEA